MALAKGNEIPTIDVSLVTIKTATEEIGLKTASKITVEPQSETTEAQKLIVKGVLISQKGEEVTITGNKITMTDNVVNPQLMKILQGGTIVMDPQAPTQVSKYTPPVAGSGEKGQTFELTVYSASYTAGADIAMYEKITYPNCKGTPIGLSSEDNVFRAAELIVNSAPNTGQAPYILEYVKVLPTL